MAMIQSKIYWAKIIGKPQPGYDKRQLEWSFDLAVDDKVRQKLEQLEVADYIKPKTGKNGKDHVSGTDFIKFSRREKKFDGSDAKPIKVVDQSGADWPEGKLIGNGSIVNVKFAVNEKASGGMKPSVIAVQVWELQEYEGEDNFPTREADGEESWAED